MRRFFLVILLFLPLSAHAVPGAFFPPNNAYEKTLKHYTKQGSHYSFQDLHAQVIWYATYASDEFRSAFQEEYKRVYPQGQERRAETKAETWTTPSSDAAFFVALYARKREMAVLDTEKSLQDVSLEVAGKFVKPILIEKIPITPFEVYFFNYVNLWYSAYRVVFPTTALRNRDVPFKLHLNGVAGSSTLKFK